MNILLVCEHTEGTDGWSRYARDHLHELTRRGHEVRVCCAKGKGGDFPVLSRPLHYLTRPYLALTAAHHLRRLCASSRPDIIHFIVEPYALCTALLPKEIVERTVLTIHGSYGIRPLLYMTSRFLALRMYKRLPRFITVSNFTRNVVHEKLSSMRKEGLARSFEEKAHVIHNGIRLPSREVLAKRCHVEVARNITSANEPSFARPQDDTFASSTPFQTHIKRILHVGGVKPLKGILEAVEACAKYRESSQTPFLFTSIGNIPENDTYVLQVQKRIEELHLTQHVQFQGKVSEEVLEEAYRRADLFLMPSRTGAHTFEGFGLVYLEANAHGVPCIGPNTSGAAEAIEEGVSGYHVDPSQPAEIATRMHWILDQEKIQPEHCRKWAEAHSIEKTVEEVEKVYQKLA